MDMSQRCKNQSLATIKYKISFPGCGQRGMALVLGTRISWAFEQPRPDHCLLPPRKKLRLENQKILCSVQVANSMDNCERAPSERYNLESVIVENLYGPLVQFG